MIRLRLVLAMDSKQFIMESSTEEDTIEVKLGKYPYRIAESIFAYSGMVLPTLAKFVLSGGRVIGVESVEVGYSNNDWRETSVQCDQDEANHLGWSAALRGIKGWYAGGTFSGTLSRTCGIQADPYARPDKLAEEEARQEEREQRRQAPIALLRGGLKPGEQHIPDPTKYALQMYEDLERRMYEDLERQMYEDVEREMTATEQAIRQQRNRVGQIQQPNPSEDNWVKRALAEGKK